MALCFCQIKPRLKYPMNFGIKDAVSKVVNRHSEGGTTEAICFIVN